MWFSIYHPGCVSTDQGEAKTEAKPFDLGGPEQGPRVPVANFVVVCPKGHATHPLRSCRMLDCVLHPMPLQAEGNRSASEVHMQAVRIHRFGPPEVIVVEDIQAASPGPHQVLVS